MPDQFVYTCDDVLRMLDALLERRDGAWWDEFFADTSRPVPFFTDKPDENLAEWFGDGLLSPGRVLELGCGQGRNAIYLASLGCSVDAVDFAPQVIAEARKRAERAGLHAIWDRPPFSLRVLRQMKQMKQMNKTDDQRPYFGEDFLWTLLADKGR